jgi:type II secretion system protein H
MKFRAANNNTVRRGFSLIELMVVLLLIAVLSAMIIPAMHGTYEDALLRSTARRLVDIFNLANSRAVTLNQVFYVRLNTKEGKYLIEPQRRASATANQFAPFEGVFDQRVSVELRRPEASAPDTGSTGNEGDPARITFYPDGTADQRELLLRDRHGFQLALRINPITARVQIVEPRRE